MSTPPAGQHYVRHARLGRFTGRLRRRVLAYRAVDFLSTHVPGISGPDEECLLLVHIRQVVGRIHYRFCDSCAQGVITTVVIDTRFHHTGLGTRALSHLRSRHPGIAWTSDQQTSAPRGLLRRMRVPSAPGRSLCAHLDA
ncbi:hypothetical protein [Streptomyces sp. NPDC048111]|uniref:hypothetical protein n=1 Tax=Streptomyces sp. NPDC048111 TaxID=3365500 RepID=UPI003716B003